MLGEVFGDYVQFLEQAELDCEVALVGFLPGNCFVRIAGNADTIVSNSLELTEISPACRTGHVRFGKIVEPVAGVSDVVVTYETVGSTEFQVVDHIGQRLEEFLVGQHPGCSHGREETPAVTLVETFGTIVTEVELREISLVPSVGETPGETGVP